MKVFLHHVYEFNKGLRHLVLYTGPSNRQVLIEEKLKKRNISYVIQPIHSKSINVFFGAPACVEIIQGFIHKPLSEWTPEQDFILGIMLGYDRCRQCTRFLQRKTRQHKPHQQDRIRESIPQAQPICPGFFLLNRSFPANKSKGTKVR